MPFITSPYKLWVSGSQWLSIYMEINRISEPQTRKINKSANFLNSFPSSILRKEIHRTLFAIVIVTFSELSGFFFVLGSVSL